MSDIDKVHVVDSDSIDGDVKSSNSGSGSRLRLDTDHHHIPDAITYQRDIKSKAGQIYGLRTAEPVYKTR